MGLHVFLTQGLLPSALAVARCLHAEGHRVTLGDHDGAVIARFSRYVSRFVHLPAPAPDPRGFFEAVRDAALRVGADVVLPLFEEGLMLAAYRDTYRDKKPSFQAAMPPYALARMLADKGTGVVYAARAGLPIAETRLASAGVRALVAELGLPLVLKPRLSTSGAGVRVVRTEEELARVFESLAEPADYVAQRWAGSRELVFQGVFEQGRCVAAHAYAVLCRHPPEHGFGILLESITDEAILRHGVRLGEEAGYHGALGLDFLADERGEARVVEINPRLVLGVVNAVDAGVPIPARAAELGFARRETVDVRRPGYVQGVRTLHWPSAAVTAFTGEPIGSQLARWARQRLSDPGALAAFFASVVVHRARGGFDTAVLRERSFGSAVARRLDRESAVAV